VPPTTEDLAIVRTLAGRAEDARTPVVVARNKADLDGLADHAAVLDPLGEVPVVAVSAVTGAGLPELEAALTAALGGGATGEARPALISGRQRAAVDRALRHIRDAREARAAGVPQDLLATSVRAALHAVGEVTGEQVDEAVLREIFSRFCIGK
jgi:tRNA modification GTPase